MKDTKTWGYINIRWNQHNSHGLKPTTSDNVRLPTVANRDKTKIYSTAYVYTCVRIFSRHTGETKYTKINPTKNILERRIKKLIERDRSEEYAILINT